MFLLVSTAFATDWAWTGPEPGFGSFTEAVTAENCSFTIDEDYDTRLGCTDADGESLWVRQLEDFVGGAALAVEGDEFYVARYSHISSGATLTFYDARTGQERWTRALTGLGPIGHSEYLNEVQIRVVDDAVEVFGWESGGRYVEKVARGNGAELGVWREAADRWMAAEADGAPAWEGSLATLPKVETNVTWTWTDTDPRSIERSAEVVDGDRHCHHRYDEDSSDLWCGDAADPDWRIQTADWSDAAAIALVGDTLYVVNYHPIASGAVAHAYHAEHGTEIWRQHLWGRGPVAHSKYRNEVQIRVDESGVVVFGKESDGRYVEVLDPSSGALRGHRALPRTD